MNFEVIYVNQILANRGPDSTIVNEAISNRLSSKPIRSRGIKILIPWAKFCLQSYQKNYQNSDLSSSLTFTLVMGDKYKSNKTLIDDWISFMWKTIQGWGLEKLFDKQTDCHNLASLTDDHRLFALAGLIVLLISLFLSSYIFFLISLLTAFTPSWSHGILVLF